MASPEAVASELESTPTPPPILLEQLSPRSVEVAGEEVEARQHTHASMADDDVDAEACHMCSYAYVGDSSERDSDDVLGVEYVHGDRDHALQEMTRRLQQKIMAWDGDARWRVDLWKQPASSGGGSGGDDGLGNTQYIEYQVQAMNEQQVRYALTEAMLRIKRYEMIMRRQRVELEKQIEQLQQHYAHKNDDGDDDPPYQSMMQRRHGKQQERELQHAVELRLKAQEVRALSKRVNLLKADMQEKMKSEPEAIERLKQIEAATLDDRKVHLKEQRALRRKRVCICQLRASESKVHYAQECIVGLRGQLLEYQRTYGILHASGEKPSTTDGQVRVDSTAAAAAVDHDYYKMDAAYEDRSGLDNLASVAERLMHSDQQSTAADMATPPPSQTDTVIIGGDSNSNSIEHGTAGSPSDGVHDAVAAEDAVEADDFSTESEEGLPEPGTKRKQLASTRSCSYPTMSTTRTHAAAQLPVYLRSAAWSSDMLASTRESLSRPLVRPLASSPAQHHPSTSAVVSHEPAAKMAPIRIPRSHSVQIPPRPRVVHVRWTQVEDELLRRAVEEFGELGGSWNLIASRVPGRSSSQCRHRWFRIRTSEAQRRQTKLGRPRLATANKLPRRTASLTLETAGGVELLGSSSEEDVHAVDAMENAA
ncbi:hypothetical protein SYNPS1DRAFT_26591 [Syncephalis pseudoplumigaleata]|uniref:Uncharacterized protein n=1 Tax=Syncephalis pseudoplumigaleata TaxID=1712513 RepID=A0A4P9Z7A2_9FUNG|nr:hypothetical protein SYNPS1DRAFT_26591 [Syncephalis pseudoplumigaleata]|eukprot:RKP27771.1 hypothetical protein SYNPS1DRAFT_26591 [Syncephalis pseudoplumigaleata]